MVESITLTYNLLSLRNPISNLNVVGHTLRNPIGMLLVTLSQMGKVDWLYCDKVEASHPKNKG